MSQFALGGVVSGLDTQGMIRAIMAVERIPQGEIKSKIGVSEREIKDYQGVNTKVGSLLTKAEEFTGEAAWDKYSATSSNESVTASTSAGAAAANFTFDVKSVATQHTEVMNFTFDENAAVDEVAEYQDGPPPVIRVTGNNADPRAIAQTINAEGSGYTAQAVQVSPGEYKLMVTAKNPGSANSFSLRVEVGGAPIGDPGNATSNSLTMTAGTDAKISFGPDPYNPGNDIEVTSASNTFENLGEGISVTVSEVADNVTVGVAKDNDQLTQQVSGLVESLNSVLKEVGTVTYVAPAGENGSGNLVGSSIMRNLDMQLSSAASGYAGGTSASVAGFEYTREGTVSFDEAKFKELMTTDPAAAKAIVEDIAGRVAKVAKAFGDADTGQISQVIKNKKSDISTLNDQIASWDRRLELRETALTRQFTAMETMMSKIQGQSNWLASQLGGLAANNG